MSHDISHVTQTGARWAGGCSRAKVSVQSRFHSMDHNQSTPFRVTVGTPETQHKERGKGWVWSMTLALPQCMALLLDRATDAQNYDTSFIVRTFVNLICIQLKHV